MLRQLARTLIVAALMFSIGLHWAVLQSAAWAGMIVSYSVREGSVISGLSQTFDAEHPCSLCGAVAFGMKTEKKDPARQKNDGHKKLLLILVRCERPFIAPQSFERSHEELHLVAHERDLRPPAPPPRRGVA